MPRSISFIDASTRGRVALHFRTMKKCAGPSKLPQIGYRRWAWARHNVIFLLPDHTAFSSKRRLSQKNIKTNPARLMCGCVRSGNGLRVCYRTHNSSTTLYGTRARCRNLMDDRHHGSGFMMNRGPQHGFGRYKYALSVGSGSLTQLTFNPQSSLPDGAKPVVLIIYADKSKLSSFGTQKGYPVIARCANLPVGMRNGNGVGGARVVGWLPVVCSY